MKNRSIPAPGRATSPIVADDAEAISRAGTLLRAGRLVAFPTETVYGLGADATDDRAIARLFAAKGRPRFNPLIVHFAEIGAATEIARFDSRASSVAERFWPGPLTIVLQRQSDCPISLLASAGLDTVALRLPSHPIARAILSAAGRPIAAPSANRSGRISPTEARHVATEFFCTPCTDEETPQPELIVDGGPTEIGVESTVLDLSRERPMLLRHGGITLESLTQALGLIDVPGAEQEIRGPGMLASHYAPALPLRLDAIGNLPGLREALLALGPGPAPPGFSQIRWLSRSGNLDEAAANLFATMRALDQPHFDSLAVMPVPEHGLGRAINDRLRRAAAPRPSPKASSR